MKGKDGDKKKSEYEYASDDRDKVDKLNSGVSGDGDKI